MVSARCSNGKGEISSKWILGVVSARYSKGKGVTSAKLILGVVSVRCNKCHVPFFLSFLLLFMSFVYDNY